MLGENLMDKRVVFRLSDSMYEEIAEAIKHGKSRNMSELVRAALEQFLKPSILNKKVLSHG